MHCLAEELPDRAYLHTFDLSPILVPVRFNIENGQVFEGNVKGGVQNGTSMALGEDKTVTAEPVRILWIDTHFLEIQINQKIHGEHTRTKMTVASVIIILITSR
jgi:hypothetical protein